MSQNQPDNLGSFISENKAVLKEYLETRMEIYRLQSLRIFSRSAGYFAWILVSLFLAILIVIFGGLMLGYWFSSMLGSYVKGFGLMTLLLVALFVLLALFRKSLFVDPVVQSIIQKSREEEEENNKDDDD
jgi:sterol desaturase/sphingolipid hydroxylase (fatty acid hydroxylase superfamily)